MSLDEANCASRPEQRPAPTLSFLTFPASNPTAGGRTHGRSEGLFPTTRPASWLASALLGSLSPVLRRFTAWWVIDEPPERAQAIVVLGGDRSGERVRHAVALHRQGWAPWIVLSGPPLRNYLSEAELMAHEARELGMTATALLLVRHQASYTLSEARVVCAFLAGHNLRRVLVSTSDYHTRHAGYVYRRLAPSYGVEVRLSAARDGEFDLEGWWRERAGLTVVGLELLKMVLDWWELRRWRKELSALQEPPSSALGLARPQLPSS